MGGAEGAPSASSSKLEGRSAVDSAWYDCEVVQRGSKLFLRFDGYGSDEEEPLRSLGALRFSSIAAEPEHCAGLVEGTRVMAFKRSAKADLWVDGKVVGKKAGRHDGGKCTCSFTVQWLATADAGKQADLRLGDLCLLDSRPLRQHPRFASFRSVLGDGGSGSGAQQAQRGAAGAAGAAAGTSGTAGTASKVCLSPEAISAGGDGSSDEEEGEEEGEEQQSEDLEVVDVADEEEEDEEMAAASEEEEEIEDSEEDEEGSEGSGGSSPAGKAKGKQRQQKKKQGQGGAAAAAASPAPEVLLRPPRGASGPPCRLCRLPTVIEGDVTDCSLEARRGFEGKYSNNNVVHRRCALWSHDPGLSNSGFTKPAQVPPVLRLSFDGGVGSALLQKCCECGEVGASVRCSASACRKHFHMHCTCGCKLDVDNSKLLCKAHSVLGPSAAPGGAGAAGLKAGTFYGSSKRQAELDNMRSSRLRSSGGAVRLGGLKKRGTLELEPVRRSSRHNNKRIRYDEQYLETAGVTEGWQKVLRRAARGGDSDGDEEDELGGSSEDEDGSVQYADDSEDLDDEEDDFVAGGRSRRAHAARRGKQARRPAPTRVMPGRERKQVKSYAEQEEEAEMRWEAQKLEQAANAKTGYEDTRCEVCAAKSKDNQMLLCDCCDRGFHTFCLDPPLEAHPLAYWYCPACLPHQDCETCGQQVPGSKGRSKKGKAKAACTLAYCTTCGALCHEGCMQEPDGSGPRCVLCLSGLTDIEAILGCRPGPVKREYFVKFKEKSYRRCRWITERALERAAWDRLQRFKRDSRDAASVEPSVQEQWTQVERVVATRADPETGRPLCLVKWRGLEYDKATWEPREELEAAGEQALEKFERRMALRVERDERAEEEARRREPPALEEQPSFLEGVGTLKDYQLEGITWVLSKMKSGMSAILGDEMGLGKTIQTAVCLQLAREQGLTTGPVAVVVPLSTFGSWEREMAKWAPGLEVLSYSGQQEARALIRKYELGSEEDDMDAVRRKQTSLKPRFHVMLTTYDVVLRDTAVLKRFDWSAVVIDEGHSLKGQDSLRGQKLRELGAPWRLLLTGTPLQNNLRELLVLLAFMADCKVEDIERRIKRMADPNPPPALASAHAAEGSKGAEQDEELAQAQAYIRKLHAYLEPRMLRRMKAVCLAGQMPPKITRKVACRMTPLQLQLYNDVLAHDWDKVNALVKKSTDKKSMNNILIRLRQTCNHPYMLPGQEPEEYKNPDDKELWRESWRLMVAASGKLTLLQQMLPRLLAGGHRVLIFSQSVEMLDILEDFLHDFQDPSGVLAGLDDGGDDGPSKGGGGGSGSGAASRQQSAAPGSSEDGAGPSSSGQAEGSQDKEDKEEGEGGEEREEREDEEDFTRGRPGSAVSYFRLDGQTKGWQRQAMMDSFNSIACKVKVFLISTRAGSLGINLQTANTVILYDPDFNPFVDMQAEGRAHRLGQEETVMVYQMYTASSVEERILQLAAKKRKLEELVTKHLGRARDVSDDDIKSSVLYGWGNLMRQAEADRQGGGADVALSEADLARLLDREHVFADDIASGADAAALLGEVRAGGAAAMQFDAGAGGSEDGGGSGAEKKQKGVDPEMEAAMMRLLAERAQSFKAQQAAKEDLGRGRRSRAVTVNYNENGQDGLEEILSPEGGEKSGSKGKGAQRRAHSSQDEDWNPADSPSIAAKLNKAAVPGENAQPNSGTQQQQQQQQIPQDLGAISSSDSEEDSSDNDLDSDAGGAAPPAPAAALPAPALAPAVWPPVPLPRAAAPVPAAPVPAAPAPAAPMPAAAAGPQRPLDAAQVAAALAEARRRKEERKVQAEAKRLKQERKLAAEAKRLEKQRRQAEAAKREQALLDESAGRKQ